MEARRLVLRVVTAAAEPGLSVDRPMAEAASCSEVWVETVSNPASGEPYNPTPVAEEVAELTMLVELADHQLAELAVMDPLLASPMGRMPFLSLALVAEGVVAIHLVHSTSTAEMAHPESLLSAIQEPLFSPEVPLPSPVDLRGIVSLQMALYNESNIL